MIYGKVDSSYGMPLLAVVICIGVSVATHDARAAEMAHSSVTAPSKTSIDSVPRREIQEISQQIDKRVADQLARSGQQQNPQAADEIFLRRVYLDIAGRIPTLSETRSFLDDARSAKRAELIDDLLDSYGYVSRQFNFWADLLRIQSRQQGNRSGQPYSNFVKDSLEQNVPYDQFVRGLLTAEGGYYDSEGGAVGYYLRDRNMPEDNMSNTIRLFLGTRLECAQCHDHPFDKWTQRQYFEMVAFTGGIRFGVPGNQQAFRELRNERDSFSQKERRVYQQVYRIATDGIAGTGTGMARLPEGYQGSDEGEPGDIIAATTMFDGHSLEGVKITDRIERRNENNRATAGRTHIVQGAPQIHSREAYAKWLTDPANPRFATVIANRLWKQAFGMGLIEPVDVIEDGTVASNPQLMNYLTSTMIDLDFDMKQFLRAIYNTDAYQATAHATDVIDSEDFHFDGPLVRRMSAEQIWDSLLTLTVDDIDHRTAANDHVYGNFAADAEEAFQKLSRMNSDQIKQTVTELARQSSRKPSRQQMMEERASDPELKRLKSKRRQLDKEIKQAHREKNGDRVRELKLQQSQLVMNYRKNGPGSGRFLRASEMVSPAPVGHFLREFGQSDREQIDNSNTEPAVTQVLSMMNGYVEEQIARDNNSILMQSVLASDSTGASVETVFLSMLNRQPSSAERGIWATEFEMAARNKNSGELKAVYADLIWTLANSHEFIFVK